MSCGVSSSCDAKIACAIDLLCDLENSIRCHSNNARLTLDQAETAERFFRQLLAANSCVIMKTESGTPVTTIEMVKAKTTQLSTYGHRVYNKALCRFVEQDLWTIKLDATVKPNGTSFSFPFFLNYLTVYVAPGLFGPGVGPDNQGPVYIATDPGISDTINPPPTNDLAHTYIVIDRDELLTGLCQLKNHLLEEK